MKAPQGSLHALPMMVDLDDQVCLSQRLIPVTRYGELLRESFDRPVSRRGRRRGE